VSRRRLLGLAFRLLALVGSVALTLLLLEGLVRLVGLESASYSSISGFCRYDPQLGWNLIPDNHTVFKGRHFSTLVETSSQGLRDRYYPLEAEPGRERILVMGDSFAWCWGVPIEDCFTKLLESQLTGTDVITMGVPGYSTAQELLLYERQGREFSPDRVVLIFVGNDPVDNLDNRKRPRFMLEEGELVLTNYPVERRKSRMKEWLRGHSRLFVQLDHASQVGQEMLRQWREGRTESGSDPPETDPFALPTGARTEEAWTLVEALLSRFQRSVAADGAKFDIVTLLNAKEFTGRIQEFCSSRGCRVLDFDPLLRLAESEQRAIRIPADGHLAPEGQQLLADALLAFLE